MFVQALFTLAVIFWTVYLGTELLGCISAKAVAALDAEFITQVSLKKTHAWCKLGEICQTVGLVALSCGLAAMAGLIIYVRW